MLEWLAADIPLLYMTGFLLAFVCTLLCLKYLKGLLPKDEGREHAVLGKESQGKATASGIVLVLVFVIVSCLFAKQDVEHLFYLAFITATMIEGFLDDTAKKNSKKQGMSPYLKGVLDFVAAFGIAGVYVFFNDNYGVMNSWPKPIVFLACAALVWLSINCTNCTDGIDGLSASLGIITLLSGAALLKIGVPEDNMSYNALLYVGILLAYLIYNCNPCTVMMGDSGSRAMGALIAVVFILTGNPFLWLLCGFMFILDGGVGIAKLLLARFFKIKIFWNIRFPLHEHMKRNLNWSVTQIVFRFAIIQMVINFAIIWISERLL